MRVSFTVDQPVDPEYLSIQTSPDMGTWMDVPEASIEWIPKVDSLESVLMEPRSNEPARYYRAVLDY